MAVNYYERHMGDYSKDTRWITTYQHGVFALFLDWYYSNEKPIPLEIAYRIVSARSGPERRAVDEVLTSFFDLSKSPGFAHNKRADLDIAKYKVKCDANALKAKGRWDATGMPPASSGHSVGNAETMPSSPQSPDTSLQVKEEEAKASLSPAGDEPKKPKIPDCPHEAILDLYHELLPANPRIKTWDGARSDALRTRWREDPKRQSLDYWRRFFLHVAASPFLTGQREGSNGRPFLPGLEWLVKAANFAKIIENRYHDRGGA